MSWRELQVLHGLSLLGAGLGSPGGPRFTALDPATGQPLAPDFHSTAPAEVDKAVALATQASGALAQCGGDLRGQLLRAIAANLEGLAEVLVPRVMAETALPEPRARGELGRTCFQLRRFAEVVEEGSWVDARLDSPDRDRQPLPKPDLRAMQVPLGPVAIFGASNFPLAFGVAGGDTASALASGCPVVAKAHPLHPGTSELVGRAIVQAAAEVGLPEGTFSLLFDGGHDVGSALVRHPGIRAVGFTGSYRGGKALLDLVQARPEPIPLYAEMGSANPVVILPAALGAGPEALAARLAASITQATGQFCTCPGLLFVVDGPGLADFREALATRLSETALAPMLGEGLAKTFREGLAHRRAQDGVHARVVVPSGGQAVGAALLEVRGARLASAPALAEELFGPAAMLVVCGDEAELASSLAALPGQLTSTLWMETADQALAARLLPALQRLAGRVLFNGVPTGVEVGHAMVHGGPWPATSAPQSTSVGTLAIRRWTRPICYQDAPESLLPPELHAGNPLGLWRTRDGMMGKE
jgi:NADP-dependent aldehyde dehydrogenase